MTSRNDLKIVFCGGGTGGHVFPALALAEGLKTLASDYRLKIMFIGTKHRIESSLVPQYGYELNTINPVGILRSFSRQAILNNLSFPFKLLKSIRKSKQILECFKPDIVVGTGGFVSGPPLFAAKQLKIPILLQEQNSHPGLTTKIAGRWAKEIHSAYELPQFGEKIKLSGNPIRPGFKKLNAQTARKKLGLAPEKKTIVILGGSQGATRLNIEIEKLFSNILEQFDIQIIWQTGKNKQIQPNKNLIIQEFFDDMATVYSASDFAIARAGALTISELFFFGLPAILVPFPYATDDHQTCNAKIAVANGSAILVQESQFANFSLQKAVIALLSDEQKMETMKTKVIKNAKPNATETICRAIINLSENHNVR